jgi:hypothetical protein
MPYPERKRADFVFFSLNQSFPLFICICENKVQKRGLRNPIPKAFSGICKPVTLDTVLCQASKRSPVYFGKYSAFAMYTTIYMAFSPHFRGIISFEPVRLLA